MQLLCGLKELLAREVRGCDLRVGAEEAVERLEQRVARIDGVLVVGEARACHRLQPLLSRLAALGASDALLRHSGEERCVGLVPLCCAT